MSIKNYIYRAVYSINGSKNKSIVSKELENHIADRIEYFTDMGYDRDTAEQMALERMGDPEKISLELSKVHNQNNIYIYVVMAIIFSLNLWFGFVCLFASESCFSLPAIIFEYSFTILVLTFLLYSLKKLNSVIPLLLSGAYAFSIIFKAFFSVSEFISGKISSGIVFSLVYILSGKYNSFKIISQQLADLKISGWLVGLSVVFYIFIFVLCFTASYYVNKLEHKSYTLKQKHRKSRLKYVCLALLTVTLVFGIAIASQIGYEGSKNNDTVTIFESDEKCDFHTLKADSYSQYEASYDWSAYLTMYSNDYYAKYLESSREIKDFGSDYYKEYAESHYTLKDFDNNIKYKINGNYIYYSPKKKYVYVISTPVAETEYDETQWIETNEQIEYSLPIEQNNYPVNINHIIITNN